jgi:hypothetical protein
MVESRMEFKITCRVKNLKPRLIVMERRGGKFTEFDRAVTQADQEAFKCVAKATKLLAGGMTNLGEIRRLASGQKRRREEAKKKPPSGPSPFSA